MGHFPRAKCPKLQPRLHLIQPWGAGRGHRGRHVTRTWHHIGRLFGPMSKFMPGGWTIGALTCFNYHKYQEYQDVELWTIEKTWSWIFWQIENSVEVELMVRLSCLTINMWCSRNGLTKSSRFSAANYALEMGDTRIPPMARYHWSLFWDKHIQRLVASTNPSEKWWSSSAGMMTFPIIMYICIYIYIYGKIIQMFQSPPTRSGSTRFCAPSRLGRLPAKTRLPVESVNKTSAAVKNRSNVFTQVLNHYPLVMTNSLLLKKWPSRNSEFSH